MTLLSSDTWIGQVLKDRYELIQQLGRTTGRRTFLARDHQTEQQVVVKVVTFGDDFEWADLRLFEREGEVLKSLDHAAIPRYLDYFDVDLIYARGYALVQSYADGRSLQEATQAGQRFNEDDLVTIAHQLLDILDYLHRQTPPVIHRDIKPSNILISDRTAHSIGTIYLVDFGSVQAPALAQTGTLTIVGTFGYMPPEQFGGRAESASDLYSLAATILYLATGQHPAEFPQRDLRIQFESKVQHLSLPVRKWLSWLLNPELSKRPKSVHAAKKGLAKAAMGNADLALRDKPLGSKIMLSKQDASLELIIPPWGFHSNQRRSWTRLMVMVGFISLISSLSSVIMTMIGTLLTAFFSIIPFAFLFSLPLLLGAWLFGLIPGIWFALGPCWRLSQDFVWQTQIQIDPDYFSFERQLTLGAWGRNSVSKVACDRIVALQLQALNTGDRSLVIRTNNAQEYRLDDTLFPFTDRELYWLGQELSNWFGLPLHQ